MQSVTKNAASKAQYRRHAGAWRGFATQRDAFLVCRVRRHELISASLAAAVVLSTAGGDRVCAASRAGVAHGALRCGEGGAAVGNGRSDARCDGQRDRQCRVRLLLPGTDGRLGPMAVVVAGFTVVVATLCIEAAAMCCGIRSCRQAQRHQGQCGPLWRGASTSSIPNCHVCIFPILVVFVQTTSDGTRN